MNRNRFRDLLLTLMALALLPGAALSCSSIEGLVGQVTDALPNGSAPSGQAERLPIPTGAISVGPSVVAASQMVGASGGTITISKPGSPLDGMVIDIPAGSHDGDGQYNVSTSPVQNHTFGEHFNPITPLIAIENGGGYSNELISVRIPVEVPADHFAMAFYYDEETGTLEGIPFTSMDDKSVTIVTRHFSKLLVSIIRNTVLDDLLKEGIDSGFRPGGDDWQFTNRGSFIEPGGHCAGQSISAMWYYCEKPDGTDPFLWDLYDNNGSKPATPDFWNDDSYGYRFASTIQKDIDWSNFGVQFQMEMVGQDDESHFKAFAYAMMLTGEPQLVGITSNAGGGHAMIAYRVDSKGIAIADPNYPGATDRRIEYSGGKFTPYNSGANADAIAAGQGKSYEHVGYCAKSALVDWSLISSRWKELKDGTIGNDRFPQYTISTLDPDGNVIPLADGYETESDRIAITVSSGTAQIGIKVLRDGSQLPRAEDGTYPLVEGNNKLGIDIWGQVDQKYKYIDFKYINVWSGPKEEAPGCRGWVLESVTPDWQPAEKEFGAQYETDYVFEATNGSFTGSGRKWIGEETRQQAYDAWVRFSHEGTWTPPPSCIPGDQKGSITFNISSPQLAVEGPNEVSEWVIFNSNISAMTDYSNLGQVTSSSSTAKGSSDSLTIELDPVSIWGVNPQEGDNFKVYVWFGCATGGGRYIYEYVFHE